MQFGIGFGCQVDNELFVDLVVDTSGQMSSSPAEKQKLLKDTATKIVCQDQRSELDCDDVL
jgi:hypothetical protein